jgi:predicted DNA-binding transcriptional regulator YafY
MAVTALKRLQGIPKFSWVDELEARLDMTVRKKSRPILMFEDASYNTGMEYFLPLYEYIADRTTVRLIYQNFRSEESEERIVYPYLLKQYNNRWFLFGTDKGYTTLSIYPLDRILSVDSSEEKFIDTDIDFATYFSDKIGVGIPKEGNEVRDILFRVPLNQKPYLVTKPLHSSQTLFSEDAEWATFSLHVRVNYELQQELLAFGDLIEILAPADFREQIKSRLQKSLVRYEK